MRVDIASAMKGIKVTAAHSITTPSAHQAILASAWSAYHAQKTWFRASAFSSVTCLSIAVGTGAAMGFRANVFATTDGKGGRAQNQSLEIVNQVSQGHQTASLVPKTRFLH